MQTALLGYVQPLELEDPSCMASLDRAEALLEELRASSMSAAQKDLDEVTEFAKKQVGPPPKHPSHLIQTAQLHCGNALKESAPPVEWDAGSVECYVNSRVTSGQGTQASYEDLGRTSIQVQPSWVAQDISCERLGNSAVLQLVSTASQ
eukprot:1158513-Pelagomonas_calceolata.AAC.6